MDLAEQRVFVLVVDDNPVVTEVTAAYLQHMEVAVASSGTEAIEVVRRIALDGARVACALVDFHLGGVLDGIETMRRLWQMDPEMRCTIVTGEDAEYVEGLRDRIPPAFDDRWDYLQKPFAPEELVARVHGAVYEWLTAAPV